MNLYFIFMVKSMQIRTIRNILALNFLEEKPTIFHGTEQAPKGTSANLKLIASLDYTKNTKMAVAASNSCAYVK